MYLVDVMTNSEFFSIQENGLLQDIFDIKVDKTETLSSTDKVRNQCHRCCKLHWWL
jgi:hypothetical protein